MPALLTGTRLGSYEILDAIGAGGMGEVYRARDTKLNREVAIKVLPDVFANDAERLARFTREAQALAALNHSNIAHIHGLEESGTMRALVMELVEGDDLSSLIARGPIPLADVISIARQIAEALEAAHEQGIIHRDLKPANIKVRSDGTVKVLDFGLAKAIESGAGSREPGTAEIANSPTITSPAMTARGVILGTAAYMAPEQARGKAVDKRADIWAFGVVLYEMLTGQRAFKGQEMSDVLAAVLTQEIDWKALPASTPLRVRRLLERCLDRDIRQRLRDIGEARVELGRIQSNVPETSSSLPTRPSAVAVGAAILAGAVIAGSVVAWVFWPKPATTPVVTRFSMVLPEGQAFTRAGRHVLTLSPDGTRLVYVANDQLYLRTLRELVAVPISGTEGTSPAEPTFSPDGQWVAFWSNNEFKKVPITGGTPTSLCAAQNPFGASWNGELILFGQSSPRGIVEVPANGGAPKLLVAVDEQKQFAHGPQMIQSGRAVLFTLRTTDQSWDQASIVAQNLATGVRTVLVKGGSDGHLLPNGILVYARETTMFAVPFDEARLMTTGAAVPVVPHVREAAGNPTGASQLAWSATGSLVYVPGGPGSNSRALVWVDGFGRMEPSTLPYRLYAFGQTAVRLSPDGSRAAIAIYAKSQEDLASDIWIWDVARNTLTRLTFSSQASSPMWTSDGKRVCYDSGKQVLCQSTDGSGKAQAMFTLAELNNAGPISPDGTKMLLETTSATTGADIAVATMDSSKEIRGVLQSKFFEGEPALSPDGRWLAYTSDESGRKEVYVAHFPSVDQGHWQVSTDGGFAPRWGHDGRQLWFATGTASGIQSLMSIAIQPGDTFVPSKPAAFAVPRGVSSAFDIDPNGRFLFNSEASTAAAVAAERPQIIFVQNWFEELQARVPGANRR